MEPSSGTVLLGRDGEQAEVKRLLRNGRLVCVTGPGGIGKTALVKAVATSLAAQEHRGQPLFPAGVQLVELQALRDPGLVANVISAECGLPNAGSEQALDILVRRFRERPERLLVLDNSEHLDVHGEISELVEQLLSRVSDLRILCTSRRSLDIDAVDQHLVALKPLEEEPAVRLVRDRVQLHSPQLPLEDEVLRDIARSLDRIPLWLEQAAARMRFATASEVRERLHELFHDSTTPTTRRRRSRSLQHKGSQVAQWTWDQCTPQQQLLWQRMAVLAGAATLDAIRAVASDEDLPPETVPALVEGLADESVLDIDRHGPVTRYRMFESYRQFAAGALRASGEEAAVRQRYADWVHTYYADVAREWLCAEELEWVQRSWAELAHLRAVLEWCATPERAQTGVKIAFEAFRARLWCTAGDLNQWGRYFFQRLRSELNEQDELSALALSCEAYTAVCQGDAVAGELYKQAAAIPIADPTIRLQLRQAEAAIAVFGVGDPSSVELAQEIIDEVDQLSSPTSWERGTTVMLAGMAAGVNGQGDSATHAVHQYRRQAQAADAPYHSSWASWCDGVLQWRRGNLAAAWECLHESLPLQRSLGDGWGPVWWLPVASWLAATAGDYLRAAGLIGATRRVMRLTSVNLDAMANLGTYSHEVARDVEQALGTETYRAAVEHGESLPDYDSCLALALNELKITAGGVDFRQLLTPSELNVARLVSKGLTTQQIAAKLRVSPSTVRAHRSRVCEKWNVEADAIAAVLHTADS